MITAHINIGSNLGHRVTEIDRAVSRLADLLGPVVARSSLVESKPWGYDSPNAFLNVGVNVETSLSAREIVQVLKQIELELAPGELHRDACGNYADRTIDLDLICLGSSVCVDPDALVPHPRMHLREFVMKPMAELMPEWIHPKLNMSAAKILENLCNNSEGQNV